MLMKIYTRTGDDGSTGLIGGDRIKKCDPRLDCYGTADELNACIGLAVVVAPAWLVELLLPVQAELFVVGAHLAAPEDDDTARKYLPALDETMSDRLEAEIDVAERELPPLKNFILPGGTEVAARLHLARTVCRRCERHVVDFAMNRTVHTAICTYLNRLSDWLFVQARLANHRANVSDVPWLPTKK
jgi:cob(I)alamin adenosyltransferase